MKKFAVTQKDKDYAYDATCRENRELKANNAVLEVEIATLNKQLDSNDGKIQELREEKFVLIGKLEALKKISAAFMFSITYTDRKAIKDAIEDI